MHEYAVHGECNALSPCPGRIPAKPDRRFGAGRTDPRAHDHGRRAGAVWGKRVRVTGCGPIGALMVLVAAHAGAADIVVTDISDFPLALARKMGASRTINVATEPGGLEAYATDKGTIHVLFEASG